MFLKPAPSGCLGYQVVAHNFPKRSLFFPLKLQMPLPSSVSTRSAASPSPWAKAVVTTWLTPPKPGIHKWPQINGHFLGLLQAHLYLVRGPHPGSMRVNYSFWATGTKTPLFDGLFWWTPSWAEPVRGSGGMECSNLTSIAPDCLGANRILFRVFFWNPNELRFA